MTNTSSSTAKTSPSKAVWISTISGLLMALVALGTLTFSLWNQSIDNAKEQGKLEAALELNNGLLDQYKEALKEAQQDLRATQESFQKSNLNLSETASGLQQTSNQNSNLKTSVHELQTQNADLRRKLQAADLCRPIQERIQKLESALDRSDYYALSGDRRSDAMKQFADLQASLRTCLSSTR